MNKKQLVKWLAEAGFTSNFSGNLKKLFVNGIEQNRLNSFGLTTSIELVAQPEYLKKLNPTPYRKMIEAELAEKAKNRK